VPFPKAITLSIKNANLRSTADVRALLKQISTKCSNVVYLIVLNKTSASATVLIKRFTAWKELNNKAIHASMSNPQNTKLNKALTLYVGSSQEDFRGRIRKHIGTANTRTYAMHLKEWLAPVSGEVEIKYLLFGATVTPLQLQIIEDSLWDHYAPLLGKRGAH
jgi:hypothetical protein